MIFHTKKSDDKRVKMDTDALYYDAIELLEALIATPRISRGEGAAADVAARWMTRHGLSVRRHGDNLWACVTPWDDAKPTLLLNSHIDTVRPCAGWTRDPYTPSHEDGCLYGLGSNDAGASLVSLLAVAAYMQAHPEAHPEYNIVMAVSAQEEVSGKGGMEALRRLLPPIDVAIVGEPTGMRPAVSEKGLIVIDAVVRGIGGHAARTDDAGGNAIYRAMEVADTLRRLRIQPESSTLGPVKITVTGINAGTQHNVIPAECRMMIDVRTTDTHTNEEVLAAMRSAVPEWCEMTPRSLRLTPSSISPQHPIVRRLEMMGYEAYGSPTLSDRALMPWASVKCGPGDSTRSHTADEYILLDEIRAAIDVYIHVLQGLDLSE